MMICVNNEEASIMISLFEYQIECEEVEGWTKDIYCKLIEKIKIERGDYFGE
jgi:hypothetical protein